MDPRHATLLGGLVIEYIRTARPVGSEQLRRQLRLQISPATVRAALHALDDEGYLEQPHTSAGRVPTDQGYRYWVDQPGALAVDQLQAQRVRAIWEQSTPTPEPWARAMSKLVSRQTHAIAVSGDTAEGTLTEAGLREVLDQPEAGSTAAVREMSVIVDEVEAYVQRLVHATDSVQVYIGREIPFFPAQYTSLMLRAVPLSDDRRIVVAIVGPKRMDYHRNGSLLDLCAEIIKQRLI